MALPESDEQIIRYLLHEMNEEELSMMEQRIENETEFFDLIAAIEDELIMQYVRGDMKRGLRPRFEKVYLATPDRRARIESARELRSAVSEVAASRLHDQLYGRRSSFLASARMQIIFVVLVVSIGIASWVWWKGELAGSKPAAEQTSLSFVLEPGRERAGASGQPAGAQFIVPSGIHEVHLDLRLHEARVYDRYQVVIGTPERPDIFRGPAQMKDGKISVIVPAKVLIVGDYTLELQGIASDSNPQPVATYYFRSAQ